MQLCLCTETVWPVTANTEKATTFRLSRDRLQTLTGGESELAFSALRDEEDCACQGIRRTSSERINIVVMLCYVMLYGTTICNDRQVSRYNHKLGRHLVIADSASVMKMVNLGTPDDDDDASQRSTFSASQRSNVSNLPGTISFKENARCALSCTLGTVRRAKSRLSSRGESDGSEAPQEGSTNNFTMPRLSMQLGHSNKET